MALKINVTQRDIENGVTCAASRCPVALAVKRATKRKIVWVQLGLGIIVVGRKTYPMPAPVRAFANDFDANAKVEPFRFDLTE